MLEGIRPIQTPKAAALVARHMRRYIVGARVEPGTRLPSEAELCARYSVSRTTIREAVRILESEGLVGVRRGPLQGPYICSPGAEIVARPAALLLAVHKVPLPDVITACRALEDSAVRRAASERDAVAISALQVVVARDLPDAYESRSLARGALEFHRALVRTSGVTTLSMVTETLHSILESHTEAVCNSALRKDPDAFERGYRRLRRSYGHLLRVMATEDSDKVATHWDAHWTALERILLTDHEGITVAEILH